MSITEWTVEVIPGRGHWEKVASVDVFDSFHDACIFIDGIKNLFPDYQFNLYGEVRHDLSDLYPNLF